eukprot:6487819-Amphidinium_carterae.1
MAGTRLDLNKAIGFKNVERHSAADFRPLQTSPTVVQRNSKAHNVMSCMHIVLEPIHNSMLETLAANALCVRMFPVQATKIAVLSYP